MQQPAKHDGRYGTLAYLHSCQTILIGTKIPFTILFQAFPYYFHYINLVNNQLMIEDFLQKKLSMLLESFIEFEKLKLTTLQGMQIRNATIKPKLITLLSQQLSVPLELVSSSIASFSMSNPLGKLFVFLDSSIKINIEGIRVRTRLSNQLNQQVILATKQQLLQDYTNQLYNPLQNDHKNSSFILNKLKEYFLGTVVLELKDFCFEIEINLRHTVVLKLKINSLTIKRDKKNDQTQTLFMEILGASLYYQVAGERQVQFMSPTKISFKRQKNNSKGPGKRIAKKEVNIDKLHLHINNNNYADILRVILLVEWHRSFINLPFKIWPYRPLLLGESKPIVRVRYCFRLLLNQIKQKNFRKQLVIRRSYVKSYMKDQNDLQQLKKLQNKLPIWRIVAYRSFCINLFRKKVEQKIKKSVMDDEVRVLEYHQEESKLGWFRWWFTSQNNSQELEAQFMKKINDITINTSDIESLTVMRIVTIKIQLTIISPFAVQPFVSLVGIHCEYTFLKTLLDKSYTKRLTIMKCKIEYQKYLGNHQQYREMLAQSKQVLKRKQSEDEFEQITYFVELQYANNSNQILINVSPFDLIINHEALQRFNIITNIQKVHKLTKMKPIQDNLIQQGDPDQIIEEEREKIRILNRQKDCDANLQLNLDSEVISADDKRQKENIQALEQKSQSSQSSQSFGNQKRIRLATSVTVIIPSSLSYYPTTELIIHIASVDLIKQGRQRSVSLLGIQVKGRYPSIDTSSSQEEDINEIINYLNSNIDERIIIKKFNLRFQIQIHEKLDKINIDVSDLHILLCNHQQNLKLLEFLIEYIPKPKDAARARMYNRRKPCIGEQFMDACQNLNQHLAKSSILSSQQITKKLIVKDPKIISIELNFNSLAVDMNYLYFKISKMAYKYNTFSQLPPLLRSEDKKPIEIRIEDLKKTIINIKDIRQCLLKERIKKGYKISSESQRGQYDGKNLIIEIQNLDVNLVLILKKIHRKQPLALRLSFLDSNFSQRMDTSKDNKIQFGGNFNIEYDEKQELELKIIPLVEPCHVLYADQNRYNLSQRQIRISSIIVNIKPSLLKVLGQVVKQYSLESTMKFIVTNKTVNSIQIKNSSKNFYHQYKHNHPCVLSQNYCELILFKTKFVLEFRDLMENDEGEKRQKNQYFQLGGQNKMIKRQAYLGHYYLQSNFRIVNHQEKTLWVRLVDRNSFISDIEVKTPKKMHQELSNNQFSQTVRKSKQSKVLNKASTDSYTPEFFESGNKNMINMALKPQQVSHILIDSVVDRYLQIYDQGIKFTEVDINTIFEESQIVLSSEEQNEKEYLIIRSEVSKLDVDIKIYTFHIYSPIYIVNQMPWSLEYKLNQQNQFYPERPVNSKFSKNKSAQLVPLKKIKGLEYDKPRHNTYANIQQMKLMINQNQKTIRLSSLIESIQKNNLDGNNFVSHSEIITLVNNKQSLNAVLSLKFSQNILKIKVWPYFVFINLTKIDVRFRIKEGLKHSQISLKPLIMPKKQNQSKKEKDRRHEQQLYLREYINTNDEKLVEKETLINLFLDYSQYIQTFAGGTLESDVERKLIYSSGYKQAQINSLKLARSGGSMSQGSENQYRNQTTATKQSLSNRSGQLLYGRDQYYFFRRYFQINEYFHLILIVPTVIIINKSSTVFYAKSSCQKLIKIGKQQHNYIMITHNHKAVSIQPCFDDQQIGLNQWLKIDANKLGTIYYSKDMINNSLNSGYQSKQYQMRKKRMKKTPRIFYRILLSKFERGYKMLIEQSQYPPISFINNTKFKLKIQQPFEHLVQELSEGDRGEYASRFPYHTPCFKLSIALDYEYKVIHQFKVVQKMVINTEQNNIVIAIEEYKSKLIVNIRYKQQENSLANGVFVEKPSDLLLQNVKKFSIFIEQATFSIMTVYNREIMALVFRAIHFKTENKNYKNYYKFTIGQVEGYDYSSIDPQFFIKPNIKHSKCDSLFADFELVMNYHKNAIILENCQFRLLETILYICGDLFLILSQSYYLEGKHLVDIIREYHQSQNQIKKKNSIFDINFIIEAFRWYQTAITFKSRNITILENFVTKNSVKWLIKFINWLGDIKPITFNSIMIDYEQFTLNKLSSYINLKQKKQEVRQLLIQYPITELRQTILIISKWQKANLGDKLASAYKIFKSIAFITGLIFDLNQNFKNKTKSYNDMFLEEFGSLEEKMIDKLMRYKYCEWRYDRQQKRKLDKKIKRLERYNLRNKILPYNENKAKIMLALESYLGNKLHRNIERVYKINENIILGLVNEWIILYKSNNTWSIILIQNLLEFSFDDQKIQLKCYSDKVTQNISELRQNSISGSIGQYTFDKTYLTNDVLLEIKGYLHQNKLVYYY